MPPLIEPATNSPGKIQIAYIGLGGHFHRTGLNLSTLGMPADAAAAKTLATSYVTQLQTLFNMESFTALGWYLLNREGVTLAQGGFDADYVGTNPLDYAGPEYISGSYTFTGRGVPEELGMNYGATRMVIYPGSTYGIPIAVRRRPTSEFVAIEAFKDWLNTNDALGADWFGQPAVWNDWVTVQFNAHWQKKVGA